MGSMENRTVVPLPTIEALKKERDALKKQNAELTLKLKWFCRKIPSAWGAGN
ncbi:hypothetical protein OYT88_16795 [Sporolactobacillus sp. CQH2019]|uniref:hypothetical protein n=1 Tax=Sporolactobacillus sp. CQH2019 TaxID=3023512 RepID=UPI002367D500|nr:hypothetical protein [Sporolactobacillus sp. CQH2019]MDD9150198.1 hypothetical protein [Sporolactobacillus sp. CQH2019]